MASDFSHRRCTSAPHVVAARGTLIPGQDYIGWGDWYSAGQNGGGAEVGQQASQHSLLTYGPSPETVTQFLIALTLNKLTMPIRLAGIVSIVPKLSQVLKHHFPRFF